MTMRFSIVNLGCKVNRVESDEFAALLLSAGWEQSSMADAQVIVVNTCTVTGEADKKSRKSVRHVLRQAPFAQIIVTGCAAAINPDFYSSLDGRVKVVPKSEVASYLRTYSAACEGSVAAASDLLRIGGGFPTRVGVKIQDGCNHACTYCIVHTARGRAVSRPAAEVLAEVRAYAAAGVGEIVLTGINLGSYQVADESGQPMRLAGLLRMLLETTAELPGDGRRPVRFRISSIEPMDVDDDLIQLLASADGRICRHLHLPLQAGSTKVLCEMARPYSAEQFLDLMERLYAAVPELSVSTDIIVGFPGETEAEFQETLQVARRCRFSKIHVFPYSMRADTPAAERKDQVQPEIKALRSQELRNLSDALRDADFIRRQNAVELAIVETAGAATTESYHTVAAPADAAVGSLVPIAMGEATVLGDVLE